MPLAKRVSPGASRWSARASWGSTGRSLSIKLSWRGGGCLCSSSRTIRRAESSRAPNETSGNGGGEGISLDLALSVGEACGGVPAWLACAGETRLAANPFCSDGKYVGAVDFLSAGATKRISRCGTNETCLTGEDRSATNRVACKTVEASKNSTKRRNGKAADAAGSSKWFATCRLLACEWSPSCGQARPRRTLAVGQFLNANFVHRGALSMRTVAVPPLGSKPTENAVLNSWCVRCHVLPSRLALYL